MPSAISPSSEGSGKIGISSQPCLLTPRRFPRLAQAMPRSGITRCNPPGSSTSASISTRGRALNSRRRLVFRMVFDPPFPQPAPVRHAGLNRCGANRDAFSDMPCSADASNLDASCYRSPENAGGGGSIPSLASNSKGLTGFYRGPKKHIGTRPQLLSSPSTAITSEDSSRPERSLTGAALKERCSVVFPKTLYCADSSS